jgi:NIMA (never in mitosis gene a)-related kinase
LDTAIRGHKESRTQIPNDKLKRWCIEILDGLDFLHKRGVIHFDLKPKNIFLDLIERIKLGDLGIARNLQSLTNTSVFKGTIPYMSPEVINEEEGVDSKTDIWSFGCVLYEMITLEVLFNEKALRSVMNSILEKKIEFPKDLESDIVFVLEK